MKAWLGRIALLLVSVGFCVGAGEIFFRVLSQESSTAKASGEEKHRFNPYRVDTELGYALRPNWTAVHKTEEFQVTVHTDARAARLGPAPAATAQRILLLGDSFAFGFGVEDDETFASVLQRELSNRGTEVEVLNAGVPGFGIDHYAIVLRDRIDTFDPDLVLVASCSNDVDDLAFSQLDLDEERMPLRTQSTLRMIDHRGRMRYLHDGRMAIPSWLTGGAWLADQSRFYNWIRYRLTRWWVSTALAREANRSEQAPAGPIGELSPAAIARGLEQSAAFRWRFHEHVRQGVSDSLRAREVPLRFVHVGPQAELMSDVCRANPTTCLDVTRLFDPSNQPSLFYASDGHWTRAGHEAVGRALAAWLEPLLRPEGR